MHTNTVIINFPICFISWQESMGICHVCDKVTFTDTFVNLFSLGWKTILNVMLVRKQWFTVYNDTWFSLILKKIYKFL